MLFFSAPLFLFLLGKFSDRWALLGGAELLLLLLIEDTHFVCSKTKHLLRLVFVLVGFSDVLQKCRYMYKNVKKWVLKFVPSQCITLSLSRIPSSFRGWTK